ncbi:hypothetical protein K504DRAFT_369520 [Pleomassaria siparia CBS 279.74]|uniref:Uncharacterized protein n=1 Tax=Pleomassaria siparia CBS 279.74 TaxID=1314801 RepID=A0A6G1KKT7_9PLEO|nr:hypothetical protein K504DRAFT_369520 [Pleomassaria siparia CBS 279.74]
MADVRSLLRQERAARQPQRQSSAPAAASSSKKRKATDEDGDERKRTRTEAAVGVPSGFFDPGVVPDGDDASPPPQIVQGVEALQNPELDDPPLEPLLAPNPAIPSLDATAQAELNAFFHEMADEPAVPAGFSKFSTGAVIESAPMTTAEIAAQAREEQSAQRARKDEEMEGEKEDAARQLEEEFDEMDGLEERFKKLREQREALRNARVQSKVEDVVLPVTLPEDVESDSDDEEWDDWRFRVV